MSPIRHLRLRVEQQRRKQRKARVAKLEKSAKVVTGNLNKSLRRHAKLNHGSVGGVGHMGRRSSKPKALEQAPAPEARPEPMKVALADYIGPAPQEGADADLR